MVLYIKYTFILFFCVSTIIASAQNTVDTKIMKSTNLIDSNVRVCRYFFNDTLFMQVRLNRSKVESYRIGKYNKQDNQRYWLNYLVSYPLFYYVKLPSSYKETIIISNVKSGFNKYLNHIKLSSKDTQIIKGLKGATIFKDSLLFCLLCVNGRVHHIALPDFYILSVNKNVRNFIFISQGYQKEILRSKKENYFVAFIFQDYGIQEQYRYPLLESELGLIEYVSNNEFIEILKEISKL